MNIEQIYKKSPHGAAAEIKRRAGVSYPTTLRTLKGNCHNMKVIKAMVSYVEEYNETQSTLENISL